MSQQPRNTTGRGWLNFDAYLFDIDGTLLRCLDAVHYFAFCEALTTVAQRPLNLDGVQAHGNVDIGILRDAFARAGIAESVWRPRLAEILARMGQHCEEHKAELKPELTPGAREALNLLRARGATLGVATGNLRSIGELKLGLPGLLPLFHFAAWSDGCEYRHEVFAHGVELARHTAGSHASILVIGDTPADIEAARANGLPVLAVASGTYSLAELNAAKPDWCFASLAEALRTASAPEPVQAETTSSN